jgi:hypothetical protein
MRATARLRGQNALVGRSGSGDDRAMIPRSPFFRTFTMAVP